MELAGAVTLATDGVHDRARIGAETSRATQSVRERPRPPSTGASTFRSGRTTTNSNLPVTHLLPITPPIDKSVYISVPEAMSPTPMLPAPRPTATDSSSWPIDVVLVHTSDDEWRRSDCSCFRAVPSEHVAARRRALCARMRSLGMSVQTETTRDGHHVLLLLAAPESLLEEMAERVSLEKSLLNGGGFACFNRQRRAAFEASAEGWTSQGWGGVAAATGGAAVATGGAWASTVTAAVQASGGAGITRRPSLFTSLERIRLVLALLEGSKDEGGCALRLDEELTNGVFTAVVPVHDPSASVRLLLAWSHPFSFWPSQPLDEVRDYLGGGIASYFAFVELLAKALLLPAVAGVLLTLHDALVIGRMDSGGPLHALFALLLLLWMCAFAKLWRRREARLAFRWGHDDPSALEGGGAEASSAAVRAVVWAQAGEGSLSNSNGRLAIRSTQGTRRGFIGEARRGFYSTDGHFVDVEEADPHARIAPTNLKFTPEQRRWRVCLSWLLVLPIVLLSVGSTTGLLTQRTLMLEASLYETRKVVILLPTLPSPTSFISLGSLPWSAPSSVSRSSLLAPGRRPPPPSTPPPTAPPLALAFPIAPEYGPKLAAAWGGSLVGVFIALTNPLYAAAARRLVEFENFRTENEHHAALMKTTLLFQALNSFAPVLWVACAKVPPVAQMAGAISQAAHAALGSGVPSSAPPRLPYCHDLARFNQTASQLLAEGGGFNGHCLDELTVQLSALLVAYTVAYTVLTKLLESGVIRARTLLSAWAERRSAYGAHERLVEQQSLAIELARVEATERAAAATWATSQQQAAFETKAKDEKEPDEREVEAVAMATPTASSFSSSSSAHESSIGLPPPASFPPPVSTHGANGTRATIGKGSALAGGGGRKHAAGLASGGGAGGSSHGGAPQFLSSRLQPRMLWGSTRLESVVLFCLRWSRPKAREASKVALANARAAVALRELRPMSYYENQWRLEPHEGVFAEYSRVVVQLGFVVLFAPAVPLGALVCYLSLLFELRSDSYKLLAETQRPVAMDVRGGGMTTGTWRHAPWILAVLGTVTNVILLGVALPQLREWLPLLMPFGATASTGATPGTTGATETKAGEDSDVVVALYVCEHLLLLGMYGVHVLVPDVPKELSIDAARLRWKADLTIAVYSEKPPQPPSEWNDAAIPANFWEAAPRTAAAVLQQHLADRFTVPSAPRQSTAKPKLTQGPMLGRGAML